MFVTATFYGKQPETQAAIPATAILHLHDRDWVYAPFGNGHFKRVEVVTGSTLAQQHAGGHLRHQARRSGRLQRPAAAKYGGAI